MKPFQLQRYDVSFRTNGFSQDRAKPACSYIERLFIDSLNLPLSLSESHSLLGCSCCPCHQSGPWDCWSNSRKDC